MSGVQYDSPLKSVPSGARRAGRIICLALAVIFLILFNFMIGKNEKQLAEGDVMILALAPVDPLSLMQGFYMEIEFEAERQIAYALDDDALASLSGRKQIAVMHIAGDGAYDFSRLHRGEPLADGEHLLEFKIVSTSGWRGPTIRISGGSFFFEEGAAPLYDRAMFAELRVTPEGRALLANLLDEKMSVIKVTKE